VRNNNSSAHYNNNDVEGGSTVLQLKTEPVGNPDSPESSSIDNVQTLTADDCAGCGRLIQVKIISIYWFGSRLSNVIRVPSRLRYDVTDRLVCN
jgi:hypothetical protein